MTRYEPIFDSAGQCVAYVGVDISMIGVSAYNRNFVTWIVALSSVFLVALALICVYSYVHVRKADEFDEPERRRKEQQSLFEQTTEALASAIDAKDPYTNGHSRRVAEYSLKIARAVGKSEKECEQMYFAALLHDVGKIGVPSYIINKKGRLTDEEFEQIKRHSVLGGQILTIGRKGSRITMQTENLGVSVSSVTNILVETADVFLALTGDQCAITDIHVSH